MNKIPTFILSIHILISKISRSGEKHKSKSISDLSFDQVEQALHEK